MRRIVPVLLSVVMVLSMCLEIAAAADVTFNGDAQYRIRYHYTMLKDATGKDSSAAPDLTNKYAWNLRLKIAVNENLMFGVRLSNPSGIATDNIGDNLSYASPTVLNLLSVPELYFKWSVQNFSLAVGAIPVVPNSVLNLVAYETSGYKGAGISQWDILLNNSQKGLDFGLKFLNTEALSVGMGLMAAIAKDAGATDTANAMVHDQIRMLLSFPTSLLNNKISVLPAMHMRFNAYRSQDLEDANHTIAGGCDVKLSMNDALDMRIGASGGMYNNSCQNNDSIDTDSNKVKDTPVKQTSPLGILMTAGITYSSNFGKAILDFYYGRSRDTELSAPLNNNVFFWDIKYGIPVKSLTIMPRMRIWYQKEEDNDATKTMLRPELILKAAF